MRSAAYTLEVQPQSPRCPYIFEVLLLQYGEEEPSHGIIIVGRHDDNANGECWDKSVEGPSKRGREVLPTVEERGAGCSNLSFTGYCQVRWDGYLPGISHSLNSAKGSSRRVWGESLGGCVKISEARLRV